MRIGKCLASIAGIAACWMFAGGVIFTSAQSSDHLKMGIDSANGIRIRIHTPDGFTNHLEIYQCTDLVARDWKVIAEDVYDHETNVVTWMEVDDVPLSFYVVGNADRDSDGDELADAREIFVHKTGPDNPDSDGDLLNDGWECAHGLNPLSGDGTNGPCGDPDNDGFMNAEECANDTDPFGSDAVPSTLPYATGFESADGFSPGPLHGQQGWMAEGGAEVEQSHARSGDQTLAVGSDTVRHNFVGSADSYAIDCWIYLSGQSAFPPSGNDYPVLASTMIGFDPAQGIMALDGDGNGGGEWVAAPGTLLINTWAKIRIEQDYTTSIWNLWVNDDLKMTGLGFRHDMLDRLHGVTVKGDGLFTHVDDMEVTAY